MGIATAALLLPAGGAMAKGETEPVVVDAGVAPDGSRYEHVVFGKVFTGQLGDGRRFALRMVCKSLRWPGHPKRNGGGTCEGPGRPLYDSAFTGVGVRFVQPGRSGEGVEQPDVVVSGQTSARVARIEVGYRDLAGNERRLPVDFARVAAKHVRGVAARLGRRASRGFRAYGVFTAFLPGADAARDELAARAAAGDRAPGQPPLGDPLWTGDLGGLSFGGSPCRVHDGWDGPFRVVAYDREGRQLPDPRQARRCR